MIVKVFCVVCYGEGIVCCVVRYGDVWVLAGIHLVSVGQSPIPRVLFSFLMVFGGIGRIAIPQSLDTPRKSRGSQKIRGIPKKSRDPKKIPKIPGVQNPPFPP